MSLILKQRSYGDVWICIVFLPKNLLKIYGDSLSGLVGPTYTRHCLTTSFIKDIHSIFFKYRLFITAASRRKRRNGKS